MDTIEGIIERLSDDPEFVVRCEKLPREFFGDAVSVIHQKLANVDEEALLRVATGVYRDNGYTLLRNKRFTTEERENDESGTFALQAYRNSKMQTYPGVVFTRFDSQAGIRNSVLVTLR